MDVQTVGFCDFGPKAVKLQHVGCMDVRQWLDLARNVPQEKDGGHVDIKGCRQSRIELTSQK
jgi:hypothetical protein